MGTTRSGTTVADTSLTPSLWGMLWYSVKLGVVIATVSNGLYWFCLNMVESPAELMYVGMIVVLPGALSGSVLIALLVWVLARLRAHTMIAGAASGALVGLAFGVAVARLMGGARIGDGPGVTERLAAQGLGLGISTNMAFLHGWLLGRWSRGRERGGDQFRWLFLGLCIISALALVFMVSMGRRVNREHRQRVEALRQAAALSPEVAQDICRMLVLSGQDPRCLRGADVRAYDFFPEIRALEGKGLTYEQIEEMFGAYKVSCGATLHKTAGDEGYFVCLYDLKGNEKYWFTFEFTTSGRMTGVSTSSAPPPP